MNFLEKKPLANYTRIGIGGPAELLVITKNDAEIAEAKKYAEDAGVPSVVLPSLDVLVSDKGVKGVVVIKEDYIKTQQQDKKMSLFADIRLDMAMQQQLETSRIEFDEVKGQEFVPASFFIREVGLSDHVMGRVRFADEGATIENTGNAKAEDVIMLGSYIKQQVRDTYGIQLMEKYPFYGF
ncbi:MAG: hypothetical protein ACPGO5_04145 [Patescibacteria group bacterium]